MAAAWIGKDRNATAHPGRKDDAGKLDFTLLPWGAVREVARVLALGAERYGRNNWTKVPDWRRRYGAAALRHVTSWLEGERDDPDFKTHHLANAACCCLFIVALDLGVAPKEGA